MTWETGAPSATPRVLRAVSSHSSHVSTVSKVGRVLPKARFPHDVWKVFGRGGAWAGPLAMLPLCPLVRAQSHGLQFPHSMHPALSPSLFSLLSSPGKTLPRMRVGLKKSQRTRTFLGSQAWKSKGHESDSSCFPHSQVPQLPCLDSLQTVARPSSSTQASRRLKRLGPREGAGVTTDHALPVHVLQVSLRALACP